MEMKMLAVDTISGLPLAINAETIAELEVWETLGGKFEVRVRTRTGAGDYPLKTHVLAREDLKKDAVGKYSYLLSVLETPELEPARNT